MLTVKLKVSPAASAANLGVTGVCMTRCNEEGTCPLKGTASIICIIQLASYCKVILMGVTCVQQCLHPTFRFDASYELCKPDESSPFISML